MKIEILAMDGLWASAEAWRLSREVHIPVEWTDVFDVDCPVNEMPSALLHFRDFTILEREIFASSRIHVMWARTSFVDSPDKYALPPELIQFSTASRHADFRREMEDGKKKGLHQDEWRQSLPVMSTTCFTCRVSYRELIKLAKYFEYLTGTCSEPLVYRFLNIANELLSVAAKFTGSRDLTAEAFDKFTLTKYLHEGPTKKYDVQRVGECYVMGIEMPTWLRAHFVRHRPLTFVDDFIKIVARPDVMDITIREPITMEIATSVDFMRSLLGKRGCWLTQSTLAVEHDPWAAIIEQFGMDTIDVLPCAGGTCPHHKDARLRIEGRDPGCPCPRYMKLNDVDPEPFRDRIDQALKSRPSFWRNIS